MGEFASMGGDKKSSFLVDLTIGGISGAFVKTIMSPVERIKILMQTQDSNPKIISGEVPRYTGVADCGRRVAAEQGVKAFWRGNLVNCLRYAPQQCSALAFNDFFKNAFPKVNKNEQFMQFMTYNLLSGGMGGATAMVICYPMDFARTRLASDLGAGKGQFNGILDCLSKTIKKQGVVGLYRGTAVSIAGAFVYRAGQLGLYGTVMGFNPYQKDKGILGLVSGIVIGTLARTVILPFNYPFDTVRRRLMLESEKAPADRMYKGGLPEVFRGFGGVMVIVLYDRVKVLLDM